jgi:hypothetical protein
MGSRPKRPSRAGGDRSVVATSSLRPPEEAQGRTSISVETACALQAVLLENGTEEIKS